MKNVIVMVLAVLMLAGTAVAGDGVYMKGIYKFATMDDPKLKEHGISYDMSTDNGNALGLAGGYSFPETPWRVEGEWTYQKNDIASLQYGPINTGRLFQGDITMNNFMANGYYDYDINQIWGLYGTAGLGFTRVQSDLTNLGKDDDTVFTYKIGAGGYANVTESITLDLGLEYMGYDDADYDHGYELDQLSSFNVMFAARYSF